MNLAQAERAYFIRKLGGTQPPIKRLTQIKREYFASAIGGGVTANTPFNELEYRWMLKVLDDAGLTTGNENVKDDLWILMAISTGEVPQRRTTTNQLLFYLHAA